MDFSSAEMDMVAASDKGAECHIEHPFTGELLYDGEGDNRKPVTIRVLGQDSREFRKAVAAMNDRLSRKKSAMSIDEAETRSIQLISSLVTGWHGIEWDGKPLECTPDNVQMFLRKFPPIRAQLDQFVSTRANFYKGHEKK